MIRIIGFGTALLLLGIALIGLDWESKVRYPLLKLSSDLLSVDTNGIADHINGGPCQYYSGNIYTQTMCE